MTSLQPKEVIRLYRHLVRLCHSFESNASLMVRDITESTSNVWLPYDVRGALLIFALVECHWSSHECTRHNREQIMTGVLRCRRHPVLRKRCLYIDCSIVKIHTKLCANCYLQKDAPRFNRLADCRWWNTSSDVMVEKACPCYRCIR